LEDWKKTLDGSTAKTYEIVDGHIKSLDTTFLNAGAPVRVAPHVAGALAQLPPGFDDTVDLALDGSDIESDAKGPHSDDGSDDDSDGNDVKGDRSEIDMTFDPLGDHDDDYDEVVVRMKPGMDPDFQLGVRLILCFAS